MQDWAAELTKRLRADFDARRDDRLAELRSSLEQLTVDGPLLVMLTNHGFSELLANWARSCDRIGIEVRSWSLVLATDTEASARSREEGFVTYLDTLSYGEHREEAVEAYGDGYYRRLMFPKTAIVHDILALDRDVLFQDVDVVWRKDPREYLLASPNPRSEARFMYDGPNPRHGPLHANTGFFLLANTPRTRALWDRALASFPQMHACGSQQQVVNSLLADADVNVEILPEEHFANGHLFTEGTPSGLPDDPYVIHCSWTGDLAQKMRAYRREGLWYL